MLKNKVIIILSFHYSVKLNFNFIKANIDNPFDFKAIFNFKNQNYEQLKSNYSNTNLFEDPIFPAIQQTLTKNTAGLRVKWLRPKVFFDLFDLSDYDFIGV